MAGLLRARPPVRLQQEAGHADGNVQYPGDAAVLSPNPPAPTVKNLPASALHSESARTPSYSDPRNAPIVDRRPRMNGIQANYVYGGESQEVRPLPEAPVSSMFQQTLVRLWPWMINHDWYIAYPAATVMNGGKHNLGLSERTPQLDTRITGGPGPQRMLARPQYRKVQDVQRYDTAPATYKTKAANG